MRTRTGQEWIAESACGLHCRTPTLRTAPVQLFNLSHTERSWCPLSSLEDSSQSS
ncbi:hypothetical protein BT69DRAFT_1285069 [Atractiella rhizophila]|nr:hypothetical protein BT69DRAFT_1285069 [Atractiella rhizophila]